MRSLVIIFSLLFAPFTHAAGTIQTNGIFGGLLLGGTTNIISDNGTTLTRNGSAISGGGGFAGAVSNSVAQSGLLGVDSTKTNGIAATFGMVTNALQFAPQPTNANLTGWSAIATNQMAPLASPALTGTPTVNGVPITSFFLTCSSNTQAGNLTCPFSVGNATRAITVLTGAVTLVSSGLATNAVYYGQLWNTQATNVALTYPAGWMFPGGKSPTINAYQKLDVYAWVSLTANDTNVTCVTTVTQ